MRIVRRLRLEMGFVSLALLAAVFGAALVMFLLYGHVRAVDQKHRQLAVLKDFERDSRELALTSLQILFYHTEGSIPEDQIVSFKLGRTTLRRESKGLAGMGGDAFKDPLTEAVMGETEELIGLMEEELIQRFNTNQPVDPGAYYQKLHPQLEDLDTALRPLRTAIEQEVQGEIHQAETAVWRVALIGGSGLLVVLAVAIIFTWLTMRAISRPLRFTVERLREIAEGQGDLKAELPVEGQDEFSELSRYFNQFSLRFRGMVDQIRSVSRVGSDIGEELHQSSRQAADTAGDIGKRLESVAGEFSGLEDQIESVSNQSERIREDAGGLIEEYEGQAARVKDSAEKTEETLTELQGLAGKAREKRGVVKALAESTGEGEAQLREINGLMQGIAEKSEQIGGLITAINRISSKTNMLSMNAAIEAAHAGEAGQGFAVVADEIRELALTVGENAGGINRMLKDINQQTETILKAGDEGARVFQDIRREGRETTRAFEEMAEVLGDLAGRGDWIREALTSVVEGVDSVQGRSRQVLLTAGEINTAMGEVQTVAQEVGGHLDRMHQGVSVIDQTAESVAGLSRKNYDSLQLLDEQIAGFRT